MQYNEIKNPEELYEFMKENIRYGFVSSYDNRAYMRKEVNNDAYYEELLYSSYFLQTPEELLKSKCGICYDQVEFAKNWLVKNNYPVKTYFSSYHNHAFLIYQDKNSYYLFERSFKGHNGISKFDTIANALIYYKSMQVINSKENIFTRDIDLHEYDFVEYGCSFDEFINRFAKNKTYVK